LGALLFHILDHSYHFLLDFFGMLPIAFGAGSGSESQAPMAVAVIGGLVTSTLLTLVVVPVVYTLFDDVKLWAGRKKSARACCERDG
jgi:hypothetical protein